MAVDAPGNVSGGHEEDGAPRRDQARRGRARRAWRAVRVAAGRPLVVAAVMAPLVALGGYALGSSGGADVEGLREAGERLGRQEGTAFEAARAERAGRRAGRRAGYRDAYDAAYEKAFERARREARR